MKEQNRNKIWRRLAAIMLGLFLLQQTAYAETGRNDKTADGPTCDMSSFMVLGDSIAFGYMAGYTDNEVNPELVAYAWPKLVADQADVSMDLTFYAPYPDNLSVPGYALNDITRPYAELVLENPVTAYVMGNYAATYGGDSSPLDFLLAENPSTVAVMIGNNDILGAAIRANIVLKTPVDDFENMYSELVEDLAADQNRAVVTATIPDVAAIPFLVPVTEIFPRGIPADIALSEDGTPYILQQSDSITLAGLGKLTHGIPMIKCPGSGAASYPSFTCVGDILTQDELEEISAHTQAFNTVIREIADGYANVAVMPFDSLFNTLSRQGIVIQGKRYTLEYDGGLISKDGIHPTKLGHGVLADEMIQTLNSNFGTDIPRLVLNTLAAEEELADGALTPPAAFNNGAFEHAREVFQRSNGE